MIATGFDKSKEEQKMVATNQHYSLRITRIRPSLVFVGLWYDGKKDSTTVQDTSGLLLGQLKIVSQPIGLFDAKKISLVALLWKGLWRET